MESLKRCFTALRPEVNSDFVPPVEKAKLILSNIGPLVNALGEEVVYFALCEIIDNPAIFIDPADNIVATAENLLPEVDGSNVDHEVHMDEIDVILRRKFY